MQMHPRVTHLQTPRPIRTLPASVRAWSVLERYIDSAGDLGGMFGLLLGGSVLSAVEIIDLLIYNAIVKLTMMKQVKPRPRLTAPTPVTPV